MSHSCKFVSYCKWLANVKTATQPGSSKSGRTAFSPSFQYHRKDHSVSFTSTNIYTNWLFGTVEKSMTSFFHSSINGVHNRSDFLLFCVTIVVGRECLFDYDVFSRLRWGPRGGLCWLARARNASAMRWGWFCIRVFQPGVSITSVAWLLSTQKTLKLVQF